MRFSCFVFTLSVSCHVTCLAQDVLDASLHRFMLMNKCRHAGMTERRSAPCSQPAALSGPISKFVDECTVARTVDSPECQGLGRKRGGGRQQSADLQAAGRTTAGAGWCGCRDDARGGGPAGGCAAGRTLGVESLAAFLHPQRLHQSAATDSSSVQCLAAIVVTYLQGSAT